MLRHITPVLCLSLLIPASQLLAAPTGEEDTRIDQAREAVYPALVNISVVGKQYQGGRMQRFPAAGSGVIISPEGHVLTNYHVAGETTRITCKLPDGRHFLADTIALDPLTDLAVLQIRTEPGETIPHARIGDSSILEIGDDVLAMGNPQTLSSSMTRGIVSNPARVFTSFTGSDIDEIDLGGGQRTGLFTRWIQHDALILPGNSGGPLVNLDGEVVGINDRGGNGMSFAIPSNLAADVLEEALAHGRVIRGWVGVSVKPVEKLDRSEGALVTWVVEGSPADQAGLIPGDILLEIDGEAVAVRNFEEVPLFMKQVADLDPDNMVPMKWERNGEIIRNEAMVQELDPFLGEETEIRPWGITVRDITPQMALSRRYPDAMGVMVTGVRPGRAGEKAQPSLGRNDVITSIDGQPITNLADLVARTADLKPGSSSLLGIRRGEADMLTVLEVQENRKSIGGGRLPRAWLGVETQVLTRPVSEALGLEKTRGFRITRVYPDTEAETAGLQTGDIIVAVDGGRMRASRAQDAQQLLRRIENLPVDSMVDLTILRDGNEVALPVRMEATPAEASESATAESEQLEFGVRTMSYMDTIRNRWSQTVRGVMVTEVENGGWGSLAGLRSGDLLVSIDDELVPDLDTFNRIIERLGQEKPAVVSLFLQRGHRTTFVFLEPEWTSPPAGSDAAP